MQMDHGRKVAAVLGAGVAITLAASGCGSSGSKTSTPTTAAPAGGGSATTAAPAGGGSATTTAPGGGGSSVLGTAKAASGSPVVFGVINDETSVGGDFPEARLGSLAAASYLNAYRGGLDGHPIQLDYCITDGTAAVSQNCANQLIAKHPVAILGSTDLASAATLPIFAKANLAEIGGVDLTPPMVTAPNSIVFNDVALAGNAAESAFIVKGLKAKSVGVIAIGDAQGTAQAANFILPVLKKLGAKVNEATIPPSVADATSGVASVSGSSPDAYFVESPSQCVSIFQALKSLGNTKPVVTIDPCSSPGVIKASNGAVDGAYFSSPYYPPNSPQPDSVLYNAIVSKYAPATMPRDSISQEGVQTVMNIWSAFHTTPVSALNSAYMLKTLKSGSNHANFLSSPYTCDSKAAPPFPAICDAVQYMHQISSTGTIVQPTNQPWSGLQYLAH